MSLVSDVRTYIGEATGVFWPDQAVYDAINTAQIYLYGKYPVLSTSVTLTVPGDADFITIPVEVMIPKRVVGTSGELFVTSPAELEHHDDLWFNTTPGTPKWFVHWDSWYLRVFPRADALYTYTLHGVPWPVEINAGTLDPATLPAPYVDAIGMTAASILMEPTRPDLAKLRASDAQASIDQCLVREARSHPHNTLRVRPASHFTAAQRGNIRLGQSFT